MGTPDTLVLDPPVVCPVCGTSHNETQTHLLGDMLATWRIGDLVRYSRSARVSSTNPFTVAWSRAPTNGRAFLFMW